MSEIVGRKQEVWKEGSEVCGRALECEHRAFRSVCRAWMWCVLKVL